MAQWRRPETREWMGVQTAGILQGRGLRAGARRAQKRVCRARALQSRGAGESARATGRERRGASRVVLRRGCGGKKTHAYLARRAGFQPARPRRQNAFAVRVSGQESPPRLVGILVRMPL